MMEPITDEAERAVLQSVDKIRELVEQGRVSPTEQRAHTKALLRALRNPEALKVAVEAVEQTVRDRFG